MVKPTKEDIAEFTDNFGQANHATPPSSEGSPRLKHGLLLKCEQQGVVSIKEKAIDIRD